MQIVKLNLIPGGVLPVCFASQNDTGRVIRFMLFEGENVFTLSGAETIALRLQKPDGSELVESVTNTGAEYVDVVTTADTCDTAGASVGEIVITDGGDVLGSANFGLFVESDAFDGGDIVTQTASGPIATFETNIETAFVSLKSDINPVQDLHGYSKPWSGGGGKNKLNYEAWKTVSVYNGTAVFENNGVTLTATTNDCYTLSNVDMRVPISEGETITLSWEETANVNGAIYIFPNGTTTGMVYTQNASNKKLSYTATSGVTFITWRFGVQSAGVTAYYKNIQIEKGSQATSFEPYSNICPISGFTSANIVRCGVNLFDGVMESGQINTNTGENLPNASRMRTTNYIQLVANQAYYCKSVSSCYAFFYDKDKTYIGYVAGSIANLVFTPKNMANALTGGGSFDNAVYMRLRFDNSTFNVGDLYINYPSSDTEYHAYNGQTATVNFGQTVYGGVADVTNGKVNATHALTPLNNKTWVKSGNKFYTSGFDNAPVGVLYTDNFNCAIGTPANKEWNALAVGECCLRNGLYSTNKWSFVYCTDAYATVEEFVSALNADCTITYPLATPIEITTTAENLTAISGENNVYSDTNGDTTVEYYIEV